MIPNAYHSPSPMNELCDYICTWEKKHILWEHDIHSLDHIKNLILNKNIVLSDKTPLRICRKFINQYAVQLKEQLEKGCTAAESSLSLDAVVEGYKKQLKAVLNMEEKFIANYVICASYTSVSISKAFAWAAYGNYIIENLQSNTASKENVSIREVPRKTETSYEYLGKYYEFKAGDTDLPM